MPPFQLFITNRGEEGKRWGKKKFEYKHLRIQGMKAALGKE